jgi:hypothetical protein
MKAAVVVVANVVVVAVLMLGVFAFAQEASAPPTPACGPLTASFATSMSDAQPPAQPEAGKALVFVAGYFPTAGAAIHPTIPVSLDGQWTGATRGSSYIDFSVDPGVHHLCVRWQSSLAVLSRLAAFARLTAEPGKTYYFRVRSMESRETGSMYLDLDPIDPDEGQYLVTSSRLSVSRQKK